MDEEYNINLASILESSDYAIISESLDGTILSCNKGSEKMFGYTSKEMIGKNISLINPPEFINDDTNNLNKSSNNEIVDRYEAVRIKKNGEQLFVSLIVFEIKDKAGNIKGYYQVARDITSKKNSEAELIIANKELALQNQEKEKKANRLYLFISKIYELIVRNTDENTLFREACRIAVEVGQFRMAWIGRIDEETKNVIPLFCEGKEEGYLSRIKPISVRDNPEGGGPTGTALREGRSSVCNDIETNPQMAPWVEEAMRLGYLSSIALPIYKAGSLTLVLSLYSSVKNFFVEEQIAFLEGLANDISYALDVFEKENQRKKALLELSATVKELADYKFALDQSSIVVLTDQKGIIKYANDNFLAISKYSREELIGQDHRIINSGYHPKSFIKNLWVTIANGKIWKGEFKNKAKNGSFYWVDTTIIPFLDNEGKPYQYMSIRTDITERKNAEEKIIESEKRFKSLIEYSSEGINLTDEFTNVIYISPGSQKIIGNLPPENISGRTHPDDINTLKNIHAQVLNNPDIPIPFQGRFLHELGNYIWLEGTFVNLLHVDGVNAIVVNYRDVTNRKELENLLQKTNTLARIGSWEVNLIHNTIYWSDIIYEIHEVPEGFKPQLSESINFYREDFRKLVTDAIIDCIEKGTPFDYEAIIVTSKNNEVWIRSMGKAEIVNGKFIRIYGTIQDINTRKIAEVNQLNLIEEKSKIFESIGDGFLAVDKNWVITYWNHSAELILGKTKAAIIGKNLWEEFPDAIDTDFYTKFHYAIETMEAQNFEAFYEIRNQWLEVNVYPTQEGLSVFFKDNTIKKELNLKIQEANVRFEKVAEATADAIWDWDIVNDKFYRGYGFKNLFGHEIDNSLNLPKFQEISFNKEDLPKIKQSLRKALLNPKVTQWEYQYRIQHSSGSIISVLDKGIIVRDSIGKAIRMIGAIKDITYIIKHTNELVDLNSILKLKLAELEIANEELEQFAYISSHDLQEPLRMVTSFMDQLQRKYGEQLDSKAHQYIEFAVDGAKRMRQIILDILEYSRAGKIHEEPQEIDVYKILDEYKILRRKVITEKKAVLEYGLLPIVTTYNTPLIHAIHNLIDNAIKYSKDDINPLVKISCIDRKDFWEFCIEDNGIGIEEKFFSKIFIIFQRLHNREKYSGTGIGLSIVKKQIESLGGKIWIESKVNVGSKFYFTIPKFFVIHK